MTIILWARNKMRKKRHSFQFRSPIVFVFSPNPSSSVAEASYRLQWRCQDTDTPQLSGAPNCRYHNDHTMHTFPYLLSAVVSLIYGYAWYCRIWIGDEFHNTHSFLFAVNEHLDQWDINTSHLTNTVCHCLLFQFTPTTNTDGLLSSNAQQQSPSEGFYFTNPPNNIREYSWHSCTYSHTLEDVGNVQNVSILNININSAMWRKPYNTERVVNHKAVFPLL